MGRPTAYQPVPLEDYRSPDLGSEGFSALEDTITPTRSRSTRRLLFYVAGAVLLVTVINFSSAGNIQTISHAIKGTGSSHRWPWNGFEADEMEGEAKPSTGVDSVGSEAATTSPSAPPAISTPRPAKGDAGDKKKPKPTPGKPKTPSKPSEAGEVDATSGKKATEANLPNPYMFGNYFDHLKPSSEERYVTGIPLGGVNNQNKGILSLLWLAKLTNRTPILPPIIPNLHQRKLIRGPSYSTFYNISRTSSELGIPIIEWNDIRPDTPDSYKGIEWLKLKWLGASSPLQCWVTSKMGGPKKDGGRSLAMPFARGLLLDVHGVYAPGDTTKGAWQEMGTAAEFVNTNSSAAIVGGTAVEKDLACLTQSYWLKEKEETLHQMQMLQTMRFTDELESLVDSIIAKTIGTTPEKIHSGEARFITVHVRRGDIAQKCDPAPENWEALRDAEIKKVRRAEGESVTPFPASTLWGSEADEDDTPDSQRLVSRSRHAKRKQNWKNCHFTDLYLLRKINQLVDSLPAPRPSVVLTTDDKSKTSLAMWDSSPGIFRVDHPNVGKGRVGGEFWDVMVDAAILTRGEAFLGTSVSTMSRLAAERGKRWYERPASTF